MILSSWLKGFKQARFLPGEGASAGTIRSGRVNSKGPQVTPALCDAAKQDTRSRQRAQASGAVDVLLTPAGSGGDGGGGRRSRREGAGGGSTDTEAGIAMGGVGVVVEYQSIDIIEQRRPHARPVSAAACLAVLLLVGWLRPCFLHTRNEPLEPGGGHNRDYTILTLGLSVQTRARVFHALPGVRESQHAILHPSNYMH